jgi:hypothetical protein
MLWGLKVTSKLPPNFAAAGTSWQFPRRLSLRPIEVSSIFDRPFFQSRWAATLLFQGDQTRILVYFGYETQPNTGGDPRVSDLVYGRHELLA